MVSVINAPDSRVNVLIRLVGILFFVLGASITYLTYQEAAASDLVPPLIPVLYLCSVMLMVAGFVAIIAKYKESGKPRAA
ncbi:MAG TPA: hypothetical protein VLX56_08125 [Nitrososphaerales archaeon]|nr:hypothetical protein [Nitrososphaerales archaeon]